MAIRVLVQFLNVTPPKDFGIRVLPLKLGQDDRPINHPIIQLGRDTGGCRTDQLLWELTQDPFRLVDIHMKIREPEGRKVPLLNYTYSDEGRKHLFALPTFEDWCVSHTPKFRWFKEQPPEVQEARLLEMYERWCASLPQEFEDWTGKLYRRSWVAGRAFFHDELICVNLVGSLKIDGNHLPFSIGSILPTHAEASEATEAKAASGSE